MLRKGEASRRRRDGHWDGRLKKERNTKDLYFEEASLLWLQNNMVRYKGATYKKYRNLLDMHILPDFGKIKISKIHSTMLNEYVKRKLDTGRLDQKGGLSPSYVRSMILVIESVIQFAAEEGMCSPVKITVKKPLTNPQEPSVLDDEQERCLEQYLKVNLNGTKVGILMTLYTGLRIGEICALSWDDIDFKNRVIHIRHTVARVLQNQDDRSISKTILDRPKTFSSMRSIPIPSFLFPILSEYKGKSNSPYVVSDKNSFMNPRTYEYRFHRILEECGIDKVNYHALRHTFATRCIKSGIDVKTLSEILGHSSVSFTLNTYVHSSMEMKRFQLEKLYALNESRSLACK